MKISNDLKVDAFNKISKLSKHYNETISEIKADTDREKPVKLNLLQAQQRMFAEEVFEILRKTKSKAKKEKEEWTQ